MGVLNLVFDVFMLVFLVRALVPDEGHMAFNRPYQRIVGIVAPLWRKLGTPEKQVGFLSFIAVLLLAGLRGVLWAFAGTGELDYKVMVIELVHGNLFKCQLLGLLAAAVFFLQVYVFLALAIALGGIAHRTDHYSRLLRAMFGPLKRVPPWPRFALMVMVLILVWTGALMSLTAYELIPTNRTGNTGRGIGAALISLALVVDLARIWIAMTIFRAVASFVPFWRPPLVEFIERVTEPLLKPVRPLRLRSDRFDFTPVVAILALIGLHYALLWLFAELYLRL